MAKAFRVPPSPALEELIRRDLANGIDPGLDIPPPPAPAEQVQPLVSPVIPEPDWRQEELEASKRSKAKRETPRRPDYPAKKQPPKGKRPTPNLDQVKRWREQGS